MPILSTVQQIKLPRFIMEYKIKFLHLCKPQEVLVWYLSTLGLLQAIIQIWFKTINHHQKILSEN